MVVRSCATATSATWIGSRGYRGTFAYEKALRKRRVWVEPLFARPRTRRSAQIRLRGSEKVNIEALLIASGKNIKRLVAARDTWPAKAGTGRGPAPTGSGESMPTSFDWSKALSAPEQGVFQQAVELSPTVTLL